MNSKEAEPKSWDIEKDLFMNDKKIRDNFKEKFQKANYKEYNDRNSGFKYNDIVNTLNKINGMDNFKKTLLFIQKVYGYTLTVNHSDPKPVLDFINFLKQLIKNIIRANTSLYDSVIDELFKDQTKLESETELTLTDVIQMFISPSQFMYQSPAKGNALQGIIEKVQKIGDELFGALDNIGKLVGEKGNLEDAEVKMMVDKLETVFEGGTEYYMFGGEKYTKEEAFDALKKNFKSMVKFDKEGSKFWTDPAKLGSKLLKGLGKMMNGLQMAKAIWNIGSLISIFDFVTYQNDFGNGQVLYYTTTEISLPVFGRIWGQDFSKHVQMISVFDNGSITNDTNAQLYVVLGSLFTSLSSAQKYLKEYIISNPTDFIDTRQYYINVMGEVDQEELPVNSEDPDDGYNKLEKFIEYIFTKHFANTVISQYFDGIDGWFNNPIDAIKSMQEKITNNQFIIQYKYRDLEGINRYYDTPEALIADQRNYIINNILESKTVLSSDLISSIDYDRLKEQFGLKNKVYGVLFGGQYRYFYTYNDAFVYVYNHVDITYHHDTVVNYFVYFGNQRFTNESDFYKWIEESTQLVNAAGEVLNHGN
ncbi:hypothetical protein SSYRP_v1c08310 [Spiroplasma syrphidicola EA-1]|uniref:Uncharacterized protein n=2 Tax=Spiroplasma syrphidicola TaxID=216945 RepID=R4UJT8_9MOLU|nr:hypothetical protein SSYRP_v1c08310 [Spiroplasma syrphidicola EA-1]